MSNEEITKLLAIDPALPCGPDAVVTPEQCETSETGRSYDVCFDRHCHAKLGEPHEMYCRFRMCPACRNERCGCDCDQERAAALLPQFHRALAAEHARADGWQASAADAESLAERYLAALRKGLVETGLSEDDGVHPDWTPESMVARLQREVATQAEALKAGVVAALAASDREARLVAERDALALKLQCVADQLAMANAPESQDHPDGRECKLDLAETDRLWHNSYLKRGLPCPEDCPVCAAGEEVPDGR